MDITGILKVKSDAVQVSDKFKKRDFVITDNSSQYPQHISMQLAQDKCGLIDQYNVGDEIKVHFNLRGREWSDPKGGVKYFNTIDAWRIEAGAKGDEPSAEQQTSEATQDNSQGDDLPF
jgi:hypothetical protein